MQKHDPTNALLDALYTVLSDALGDMNPPVPLLDATPEDGQAFPFVEMGEPETRDDSTLGIEIYACSNRFFIVSQYNGTTEAAGISDVMVQALTDPSTTFSVSGYSVFSLVIDVSDIAVASDGITREGELVVRVVLERDNSTQSGGE